MNQKYLNRFFFKTNKKWQKYKAKSLKLKLKSANIQINKYYNSSLYINNTDQ